MKYVEHILSNMVRQSLRKNKQKYSLWWRYTYIHTDIPLMYDVAPQQTLCGGVALFSVSFMHLLNVNIDQTAVYNYFFWINL